MFKRFSYTDIDPNLIKELTEQQIKLSSKVVIKPLGFVPKLVAGVDSSLIGEDKIFSVFVIFSYPDLEVIEVKYAVGPLLFPYIPGFLAFREVPNLLTVYEMLENKPELIFVDGNGIIHKRKLGIASHLGILLNIPSFGIAKKLLVGSYQMPGIEKGSYAEVIYKDEQLGYALRSKDKVKPVFVSPGHLINLADSLSFAKSTLRKHKLPEPTRIADKYSKSLKLEVDSK